MANPIAKNYRLILKRENRRAESIATSVLGIRPISVWEVLIPVLFIFGFMQTRQRRDLFAQNLMFTKRTALRGARDMRLKNLPRSKVLATFDARAEEILKNDEGGVYSLNIQRLQRREIELLLDHYLRLLEAQGNSYNELIRSAYEHAAQYQQFIESLMAAESEVMEAAKTTLGTKTDREALERLRNTSRTAYLKHAARVYPHPESGAS